MKKLLETGLLLFAVYGFWGMIYPDLCFTTEVCVQIDDTADEIAPQTAPQTGEEVSETASSAKAVSETASESSESRETADAMNNETGMRSGIGLYTKICETPYPQIRFRSKLFTILETQFSESKGQNNVTRKQ